jgi:hypothetical protein
MHSSPGTPTGTGHPWGSSTYAVRPLSGRPIGMLPPGVLSAAASKAVAVIVASVGP